MGDIHIPVWLWGMMATTLMLAGGWAFRVERQLTRMSTTLEAMTGAARPADIHAIRGRLDTVERRLTDFERKYEEVRAEWSEWRGGVRVQLDSIQEMLTRLTR